MSDEEDEVLQKMMGNNKKQETPVPQKKEEQTKPVPTKPQQASKQVIELMVGQVEKSKKKKGIAIFTNNPFKSYIMKLTNEPRLFLNELPKDKGGRLNYQKDIILNKGL